MRAIAERWIRFEKAAARVQARELKIYSKKI